MPALRELQLAFTAALFDERDSQVLQHIRADDVDASERLDIYRNNLREGFIKALALGFPVIERLVGADYFRQLALEFLQAHPSRSGNLHRAGEPFSPWLRKRFASSPYAYFADVAALEWAHQEALIADDAQMLTAEAFRDIDPADYEHLTFELHPACSFVKASCPVVRIWRVNQPETRGDAMIDLERIDLASAADQVLVLRTPECVEFHCLAPAQFAFFEALGRGQTLGIALDLAQAVDADFDVSAALRQLLALNILTALHATSR